MVTFLKVLVFIVCPPLGVLCFVKEDRAISFLFGMMVAGMISITTMMATSGRVDSDSELLIMKSPDNSMRNVCDMLLSPISFYHYGSDQTRLSLKSQEDYLFISGNDVIYFDKSQNKYVLNFNNENRFGHFGAWLGKSIEEAQQDIDKYSTKLTELSATGNLVEIAKAQMKLDEANEYLNKRQAEYTRFYEIYSLKVNQMNALISVASN